MGQETTPTKRVSFLDELRALTVLSMVAFHASYDLAYIYALDMPWFTADPFQEIWRCSISWTFLLLAGWMTHHSRSNMRRGCIYAAVAVLVWIATTVAAVDTPVNFGIIYCMAACTLIYAVLHKVLERIHPAMITVASLTLFFVCRTVPRHVYALGGLAWLGFPSAGFASGDYYPLVPFLFMYLTGASLARWYFSSKTGYPDWMYSRHSRLLSSIGKNSLIVYVLHQPIVLGVLMLVMG